MSLVLKKRQKAQISTEFLLVIAAMIFSLIAFFVIIQKNIEEKNSEKEQVLITEVALSVKEEIDLATSASDGYFRQFKTPLNIMGEEYSLNITDNHIYVHTRKHATSFKVQPVIGQIKKGVNNITKINKTVYLNK